MKILKNLKRIAQIALIFKSTPEIQSNKIKINWLLLKCKYCRALLASKVDTRLKVRPLKKFCPNCGSDIWFSVYKENLTDEEKLYGILVKNAEEKRTIHGNEYSSTQVWIEYQKEQNLKPKNNIIKSKKRKA